MASQLASSGRDDSAASSGRRNPSISSSGGNGTGGSPGLSIGASVAVTALGESLPGASVRRVIHHAPPATSSTISAAMIGDRPGVVHGALGGGTRRLVACSKA